MGYAQGTGQQSTQADKECIVEPSLRMSPIDVDRLGNPVDPQLHADLQAYCTQQFGAPINPAFYHKLWCMEAAAPDYREVIGVAGIRMVPDCCTFHVTPPVKSLGREAIRLQHFCRDMGIVRLLNYCSDMGQRGAYGLIYVSPEQQGRWASFLERSRMTPANRYQVIFP